MKIEKPSLKLGGKTYKMPDHISMKTWRTVEKWAEDYAKLAREKDADYSALDEVDACLDNLALIYGIDRDTIEDGITPEEIFPAHAKAIDYVRTRIYKALEDIPAAKNDAKNG